MGAYAEPARGYAPVAGRSRILCGFFVFDLEAILLLLIRMVAELGFAGSYGLVDGYSNNTIILRVAFTRSEGTSLHLEEVIRNSERSPTQPLSALYIYVLDVTKKSKPIQKSKQIYRTLYILESLAELPLMKASENCIF